jgi:outer membrane protein OmpA-like peptidoglycan-associated protein
MARKGIVANLVMLLLLISMSTLLANAQETKVRGMINTRTGETLIVQSSNGETTTVVLTDSTRTKDNTGVFGLGRSDKSDAVLIPGLKVVVDGTKDEQGRVVAKTITVDGDDLETSEMIQAGLHPTAEQVAANVQTLEEHRKNLESHGQQLGTHGEQIATHQASLTAHEERISKNIQDISAHTERFMALADFEVKDQATLQFKTGSSKLSESDTQELKRLAEAAKGLTGYIIEVTGYADSTGNAVMNTRLSEQRAKAVITFLMQEGGVPVRHIVAPGAMGAYAPVGSNETAAGRAANRRVEVKVLVNKGIAGQ